MLQAQETIRLRSVGVSPRKTKKMAAGDPEIRIDDGSARRRRGPTTRPRSIASRAVASRPS